MLPVDRRPQTLRTIFDQVADEYDAVRPGYPPALIDDIIRITALPANGSILEIGCGTGQATLPFAQRGYRITCLDIGPALAARAAANLQAYPNVAIHVSSFEDWPAQSEAFDLVMSATAFHWISPQVGYPKATLMLKPGGALAIFSNEHPTPFTGFFADVQPVYRRVVPEWSHLQTAPTLDDRIAATAATINETALFAPVIVKTYPWSQTYTTRDYLRLLDTYSDHRNLAPAKRTRLSQEIADVLDAKYGGTITKPYLAVLYIANKEAQG